jgi:hypothetical protein
LHLTVLPLTKEFFMTDASHLAARIGATPEEWQWAMLHFGADLLPAVGDPNPTIPRTPRLSRLDPKTGKPISLAKTPSMIGSSGTIHGISGWVAFVATYDQVVGWSRDPALNILLNTRTVRAIDIDIDDRAAADAIEQFIVATLGVQPPVRYRAGSGKRTLLIRLDPHVPIRKRVVQTSAGAIEFLADGQQTALCGTHPSGERFLWRHHEQGVPVVPLDAVAHLWDVMVTSYEPTAKRLIDPNEQQAEFIVRNSGTLTNDPVLKWLDENGVVKSYEGNGTANITCPWESEHSSDTGPNSTSWLPAGLGGKAQGGFRCLHSHCQGRNTPDFLRMIGYEKAMVEQVFMPMAEVNPIVAAQNEVRREQESMAQAAGSIGVVSLSHDLAPPPAYAGAVAVVPAQTATELALSRHPVHAISRAIAATADHMGKLRNNKGDYDQKGITNAIETLRTSKDVAEVMYDEFKAETYVRIGGTEYKPLDDNVITTLREVFERRSLYYITSAEMSRAVSAAATIFTFDSSVKWLAGQQWDGTPRLATFARDILKSVDTPYGVALGEYLWVAMAARVLSPGVKADMAPIFISPKQGTGKSSLVRAMAPFDEWYSELDLANRDDDTARLLRGKVVVELPELKGLASRDAESIKAWMTKQTESWVPKYKEYAVNYPRRCIFIGTDNRQRFLSDPSGNRRWLPIRVAVTAEFIDWPRMQAEIGQYWAEARTRVDAFPSAEKAVEFYSKRANGLAEPARLAATMLDECFDEVREFLSRQNAGHRVTVKAIKDHLRMTGPHDNYRVANTLRMLGYEQIDNSVAWHKPEKFIL